jgi:hypothetical protein
VLKNGGVLRHRWLLPLRGNRNKLPNYESDPAAG